MRTGLLIFVDKPIEKRNSYIFDTTHGLRFFISFTSVFFLSVLNKTNICSAA